MRARSVAIADVTVLSGAMGCGRRGPIAIVGIVEHAGKSEELSPVGPRSVGDSIRPVDGVDGLIARLINPLANCTVAEDIKSVHC